MQYTDLIQSRLHKQRHQPLAGDWKNVYSQVTTPMLFLTRTKPAELSNILHLSSRKEQDI